MRCPRCQTDGPPLAKFCSACGAALDATTASASTRSHGGERKHLTVLFADVKGSMELVTGRDPEEARRVLDPVLQLMIDAVHRYGGTVNQVMGDGIMALFGAPIAQEDHALRACWAAVRIQESVAPSSGDSDSSAPLVQIRIGINSGDVVVRSIEGGDLHPDYTAVGQAASLAARMEQLAVPGTILVTEEVVRLAGGRILVKPLGPRPIRGVAEPREVFELRAVTHGEPRFADQAARGLTPLVGRGPELEALGHALRQTEQGRGQVVALIGEAGVGKSRLAWELVHSPAMHGWRVLTASAASYETETVHFLVIQLLKAYFGIEHGQDARSIQELVMRRVQRLDATLSAVGEPILALLEALPVDSAFRKLDAPERRRRTLECVPALLVRESREQPLLVVLEDLHWIDSGSRTVLESLIRVVPESRMLVAATFRSGYQPTLPTQTDCLQLRIDPLPSDVAGQLLDTLLGTDGDLAPLKALLVERCGGNPFFLEETVRTLAEEGVVGGRPGAFQLRQPLGRVRVAASVRAVLTSRIDRLAPEDKELLQSAAVIGEDVPYALLEMIADRPEHEVRQGLMRLCASELLQEMAVFPEAVYAFKHALTHEVAYASMLLANRTSLHARIVDAIERRYADRLSEQVERLAHHSSQAQLWAKAFDYLRMAGANAYTRGALEESIGRYEAALATVARLPAGADTARRSIDVRLDLHAPLMTVGRTRDLVALYPEAERLAREVNDQIRLGQVLQRMSQLAWLGGAYRAGAEHARQALAVAEAANDAVTRLHAHYFLGLHSHALGDYRGAIPCFAYVVDGPDAALASRIISVTIPMDVPAWSWLALTAALIGDVARAEAALRRATTAAEVSDFPQARVITRTVAAVVLAHAGRPASCVNTMEHAVALCERIRFVVWLPGAYSTLGLLLTRVGQAIAALPYLERSVAIHEKLGLRTFHGQRYAWWAEGLLGAGKLDEARERAETAIQLAVAMEERGVEVEALLVRARIARARGAEEEAREGFERAIATAAPLGARLLEAHGYLGLGGQHRATADQIFRETGATPWWS